MKAGNDPGTKISKTRLAAGYLLSEQGDALASDVHRLAPELDQDIARLKLAGMGIEIDVLTGTQERYLGSWDQGT